MSNYIGIPCAHCGHPFEEGDDVVVCPTCGAPHHRSCYREAGHCAHAQRHASGFSWQPPAGSAEPAPGARTVICRHCNTVNPGGIGYCQMCGTRLEEPGPAEPLPSAAGPDAQYGDDRWEVDGVTAKEISAYVGNGTFYFLRQFRMLLGTKLNVSWNWPAFFFNYIYLFYRKLYAVGVLVGAFFLLTDVPTMLYSIEYFKAEYAPQLLGVTLPYSLELMQQMEALIPWINAMRFILCVACGLFANKLFLKKLLADVHTTRAAYGDNPGSEYFTALYHRGRPNRIAIFAVIGLYFLFYSYLGSYLVSLTGLS